MKLGLIGLGRMGKAIVYRLIKGGHNVIAYDPSEEARNEALSMGAQVVDEPEKITNEVDIIWLMVPAGETVDKVISQLSPSLKEGQIIVDGGNSNFVETIRRSKSLEEKGVYYLDCGTSGGLAGKTVGFSLMIGGERSAFEKVEPVFAVVAAKNGYGYMGPSGSGHYVKMIHNGVEYALLQSYAEGFHLLKEGHYKDLDLAQISHVWNNGGVVRSWILQLLGEIFDKDQDLAKISGSIDENKTGRWTSDEAAKQNIPVDLINRSLEIRAQSRKDGGNYGTKVVAMLRNKFGGHPVKTVDKE